MARSGRATRNELTGSTITLTSLGALGGIVSTPIINAPEVAIVGVNRIVERPMLIHGALVARKTMAEMTLDHWTTVMNLNLTSTFLMIKAALPHYKSVQYSAVNSKGEFETSSKTKITAVTLVPRHSEQRQHLRLAERKVTERNAG